MSKITLANLADLQNETTAVTVINSNSSIIQTAMDNTLSRDGTSPNQMGANLDMNSFRIMNLPQPATSAEPLRLQDLSSFAGGGTVTNIPVGGNTRDVLVKNSNANFDAGWSAVSAELTAGLNIAVTGTSPATIATISNPVFSTSVTTPTLINTGTLTLPTTSDTLVGRATTDTLTNKTLTSPVITIQVAGSLNIADGGFSIKSSGDLTKIIQFSVAGVTTGTTRTLTFPNVTDTLVTKTSTDTFTNKTFDTAGTGNVFKINTQTLTAVSGASGTVATSSTATSGTIPRWVSGVLTTGAISDDGTNIVVPGNAQIPSISGGSSTNSTFTLKSTTNASPSGDVVTIQAQSIFLTGKTGLGTSLSIGTPGSSGVTGIAIAGASGGSTTVVPTASASGTLTLPAATDTLIGKATTDTLTNKTFNTTATGNNFQLAGTQVNNTNDILNLVGATQGQILYRNATQWTVLSPGTTGQFLQTLGPAANPIWQTGGGSTASGNRTLINTLTASASATLSDTTSFTSTFSKYVLVLENLVPATNATGMQLQVHNAGSFPATSYEASATLLQSGTATAVITPTTNISISNTNVANTSQGLSGEIYIENPSNASVTKNIWGQTTYQQSANGSGHAIFFGRWTGATTAVDGFQVFQSSGNLTSGTIKVYGIVN